MVQFFHLFSRFSGPYIEEKVKNWLLNNHTFNQFVWNSSERTNLFFRKTAEVAEKQKFLGNFLKNIGNVKLLNGALGMASLTTFPLIARISRMVIRRK